MFGKGTGTHINLCVCVWEGETEFSLVLHVCVWERETEYEYYICLCVKRISSACTH